MSDACGANNERGVAWGLVRAPGFFGVRGQIAKRWGCGRGYRRSVDSTHESCLLQAPESSGRCTTAVRVRQAGDAAAGRQGSQGQRPAGIEPSQCRCLQNRRSSSGKHPPRRVRGPRRLDDARPTAPTLPHAHLPARRSVPPDEPLPVVVNFHGGGWVSGNIAAVRVVGEFGRRPKPGVGGRVGRVPARAREPVPRFRPEDCYAGTLCGWPSMPSNCGIDPDEASRVMGDSAGGNLAAVVSHDGPRPFSGPEVALQVLLYPVGRPGVGHYPSADRERRRTRC